MKADEEFMLDYDEQIKKKLYEVENVEDELEQLTDDEEEINKKSKYMPHARAIYDVKKRIRISFKRSNKPPTTETGFYNIGRVIGRGSYGKVNLGIHKLVRKLVAIKSVNKKFKYQIT